MHEGVEIMRRMVGVVEEIAAGVETSQAEDEDDKCTTTAAAMVAPQMTVGLLLPLRILNLLELGKWGDTSGSGTRAWGLWARDLLVD